MHYVLVQSLVSFYHGVGCHCWGQYQCDGISNKNKNDKVVFSVPVCIRIDLVCTSMLTYCCTSTNYIEVSVLVYWLLKVKPVYLLAYIWNLVRLEVEGRGLAPVCIQKGLNVLIVLAYFRAFFSNSNIKKMLMASCWIKNTICWNRGTDNK